MCSLEVGSGRERLTAGTSLKEASCPGRLLSLAIFPGCQKLSNFFLPQALAAVMSGLTPGAEQWMALKRSKILKL